LPEGWIARFELYGLFKAATAAEDSVVWREHERPADVCRDRTTTHIYNIAGVLDTGAASDIGSATFTEI
jgi:hypothetical protein